ncbi:MAG: hypothetical protein EP329_04595 [Deltaproteobacteria bacterium]|nr:MAG: hypothetical protein EP329_04595 [Deltaproteobacteria bacterium]
MGDARVSTLLVPFLVVAFGLVPAACGGSDSGGSTDGDTTNTTANEAPVVSIKVPADGAIVPAGQPLTFTGTVSDDHDAADALTVLWLSDREASPLSQAPANSLGGTTIEVNNLAAGTHVITLGATDSGGKTGTATITITVNSGPTAPEVTIAPPAPTTTDDLVATVSREAQDPNRASSALTYSYRWFKNGTFANLTSATVPAALTAKDDVWEVRVVANDGLVDGAEGVSAVTVANTPPSCDAASIFPTAANTTKDITCTCSGFSDADDDDEASTCTFYDGATPLAGDGSCTLTADATDKGMQIHCSLVPGDGDDDGDAVTSGEVPILNAPPTAPVVALAPTVADATTTVTCSLSTPSTDPDGDSVTYTVAWLVDGFENTGVMSSSLVAGSLSDASGVGAHRGSRLSCRLRASDGEASSAPATSAELVLGNAPPAIDNVIVTSVDGAPINENAVLRCEVGDSEDPDGDPLTMTYVWYVGGEEVAGVTGQNLTGAAFDKGDSVSCAVRADDGQGGQSAIATSKTQVVIGNALPSLLGASLDKTAPSAFEQVTCIPEGWQDPDGDPLEVVYAWYANDGGGLALLAGQTSSRITPDTLSPGDQLVCEVTPKNGVDLGTPVQSAPATIAPPSPTAPIVTVNAPDGADGAVRCDFVEPARHFTGTVSYTFYWRLNGGTENQGNATITGLHDCDLAACRAVASDGSTSLSSAPAELLLPVGSDCDTGNDCRTPTCDPGGGCDFVLASDITCDDGNGCTTGDHCELGFCIAGGFAGDGASCEDGSYCTSGDTCDGAGNCNGGADPCTATAGGCLVGSCDELQDKCIVDTKPAGSACNDHDGCTSGDSCSANGVCLPGSSVTCTGTADECNEAACVSLSDTTHSCQTQPLAAGAPCTSTDFCVVDATCDGQGNCGGGDERDCEAEVGDDCNTATCDPTLQRCLKIPAATGTSCNDGNACTIVDTCVNGTCEGTGDACVEEQISLAGGDQRPAIVSIGYGRYVTQWWATAVAPTHFRYSDAYGSRENEEIATPNAASRVGSWDTRMAARSTGTIAVPFFDGTVSASAYSSALTAASSIKGVAHDLAGARLTSTTMFAINATASSSAYNKYVAHTGAKVQALALLDGSFAFVAGCTIGGTAGGQNCTLAPNAIFFYPPTGLMTTGTRTELVGAGGVSGLLWDAKSSSDGTGTFMLAWVTNNKTAINVRRYTGQGQVDAGSSNPWTVFTTSGNTVEQVRVLPMGDSRFVVAWDVTGEDGSGRGVYAARFDSEGNIIGSAFRVNTQTPGDQRLGEVARFSNNDFVIVFDDANGDTNGWGVKARLYTNTAQAKGGVMDINTRTAGSQYLPTVEVLDTDEWVVAFIDDQKRVWTRRYLPDGGPSMGRIEWQLNATTAGGQKGVVGARAGNGAVMAAFESPVYGKQEGEILARMINTAGPTLGAEFMVNQTDSGPQLNPAVAGGAGHFAVAWESGQQDDADNGVFVRFYDTTGAAVTSEVKVNTTVASFHRNASVAMTTGDNAVVAWAAAVGSGSIADVFVRVVSPAGELVTQETRVNDTTAGIQDKPSVAVGSDGNILVAWQSNGQDGSYYGVYVRKLDPNGNALSDEVLVNTTVDLDQKSPSLAIAPSGNRFTVCWESLGQDAPNSLGVYCQVMDYGTLSRFADEVRIGGLTAGEQRSPDVAYMATGEIIVGWDSEGVDSDQFAVAYRRLTADGAPSGARVVGNRTWAGSQEHPAVVPLSGAGVLVMWESTDQDGEDKGIYFRTMSSF